MCVCVHVRVRVCVYTCEIFNTDLVPLMAIGVFTSPSFLESVSVSHVYLGHCSCNLI